MTLKEIEVRLSEIPGLIDSAEKVEEVNALAEEKKGLLVRKSELEDLEQRKKTALDITSGAVKPQVIDRVNIIKSDFKGMTPEEIRGTEEYRSAYFKRLMGRTLNDIELRANEMASTDVAGVIPTITANKVVDLLVQDYPILGEIDLFQVPGNLTVSVDSTNNDAALHAQNTAVTPAADALTSVTLGGFEIVKVNRISATVNAMAVSAFEQWLMQNIFKKLGRKMAYYVFYGSGSSQPKGIDYMDTWSDGSNAVDWASTSPTAAELVEFKSYLGGAYQNGAKFAMKASTFWGHIVPVQVDSNYKILTPDYKRLLGDEIIFDDNIIAGDIFYGNFKEGVIANISAPITVLRSEASGFLYNAIDYRGACLFDCDVKHTQGFVKSAADLTAGA